MTQRTIDDRQIPTVQYSVPTTGQTITASVSGNVSLLINPAGTLVALTLSLNGTPTDGDTISIGSSQVVTGFTMSNGTIVGALTSLAVATFAKYIYSATSSTWFRIG